MTEDQAVNVVSCCEVYRKTGVYSEEERSCNVVTYADSSHNNLVVQKGATATCPGRHAGSIVGLVHKLVAVVTGWTRVGGPFTGAVAGGGAGDRGIAVNAGVDATLVDRVVSPLVGLSAERVQVVVGVMIDGAVTVDVPLKAC